MARAKRSTVAVNNGANLGFEEAMKRLTTQFKEQFVEFSKLEETIRKNLKGVGYEI